MLGLLKHCEGHSFQVVTTLLSAELRGHILPEGHVVADIRRLLNYFRLDNAGRSLMGGRGGNKEARSTKDYSHLLARKTALYPALENQFIEYAWSGRVALTLDKQPHIHKLAEGVYTGLGYNGRGVGMATLMGKWLAELSVKQAI
ncbi:MAG: glycine/D-amino acid oxidase-like deaminating enzyme [Gammaproteobacteria bacterium]|jgi:glycine/D-amino acid oxidase-like deaminating enzyme